MESGCAGALSKWLRVRQSALHRPRGAHWARAKSDLGDKSRLLPATSRPSCAMAGDEVGRASMPRTPQRRAAAIASLASLAARQGRLYDPGCAFWRAPATRAPARRATTLNARYWPRTELLARGSLPVSPPLPTHPETGERPLLGSSLFVVPFRPGIAQRIALQIDLRERSRALRGGWGNTKPEQGSVVLLAQCVLGATDVLLLTGV